MTFNSAQVAIPQNPTPTQQQRLSQEDCDKKIASTFGGPGAVAATATEPSTLQHPSEIFLNQPCPPQENMKTALVFCIVASQFFFAFGCPRFAPRENEQSVTVSTARADVKRVWRAATYRGLTMGRSNVDEMLRILGAPKESEVFNNGTSNAEVWYHYEGSWDFPGTLRVIAVKATNTVQAVDIQPNDLKAEEAIKHFGADYIVTRYDFDSCLGNEESAPLFETRNGSVIFIEYRQRGIAIAVNGQGKVNEVSYISEPIGAESSKCKK